jgi:hypothetical protein
MPARSTGLLGGSDIREREHTLLDEEKCRDHDAGRSEESCAMEETRATTESLAKQASKYEEANLERKSVVPKNYRIRLSGEADRISAFSHEEIQDETKELGHEGFLGHPSRRDHSQEH